MAKSAKGRNEGRKMLQIPKGSYNKPAPSLPKSNAAFFY
jgi:hypothetical protein